MTEAQARQRAEMAWTMMPDDMKEQLDGVKWTKSRADRYLKEGNSYLTDKVGDGF